MTLIAWDGKVLAADRNLFHGDDIIGQHNKLLRIDADRIGAFCGVQPVGWQIVEWLRNGGRREEYPSDARNENMLTDLFVVHRDGTVHIYGKSPWPSVLRMQRHAIGMGAEYARAAMQCGRDAVQAIEVAAVFNHWVGGGVDTMAFDG